MTDRTALSWWFPRIEAAGLPLPKTIIIDMPAEAQESIWALFDGESAGDPRPFCAMIGNAGDQLGWPLFLRTDHTAAKHRWSRSCCVPDRSAIPRSVGEIAEYSELAGGLGLPWDRWAAREMLPTEPVGTCPSYGNMPICREFRAFAADGRVQCIHPYWPLEALTEGDARDLTGRPFDRDAFDRLSALSDADRTKIEDIAAVASAVVGGAWSIDCLATQRGWFLTDMAEAHKSFHWAGCPNEEAAA